MNLIAVLNKALCSDCTSDTTSICARGVYPCDKLAEAFTKILDEWEKMSPKNPYPKDIWIPMTKEQLKQVHELLQKEMSIPLDRLSGEIGRRIWNGFKDELKQSITTLRKEVKE